jgi:hypothetical protein
MYFTVRMVQIALKSVFADKMTLVHLLKSATHKNINVKSNKCVNNKVPNRFKMQVLWILKVIKQMLNLQEKELRIQK